MKKPRLELTFVPNAYTDAEGKSEVVASFVLEPSPTSANLWALAAPRNVTFPTGETIQVMSEVTPFGNYFHAYHGNRRICSLKATGSVSVMFLLPSGQEAFAKLSDGSKDVVS